MHGHKWLEPDELLWRLHPDWFLQDSPLQLGKRFLCTCGKSGSAGRSTALLNSLMMYWYIMIYSNIYLESIIQKNIILWCIQTVDMVREFTWSQIHVLSSCCDARGQVTNHSHTGCRGKKKMNALCLCSLSGKLPDWLLKLLSWPSQMVGFRCYDANDVLYCSSPCYNIIAHLQSSRKSLLGDAFGMDCVRIWGPWCGHVGTFFEDFGLFLNVFRGSEPFWERLVGL